MQKRFMEWRGQVAIAAACVLGGVPGVAQADNEQLVPQSPLIVLGASFGNGVVPLSDDFVSPLFGVAVAGGSYLSLGDGLVRTKKLPGFLINEAQAGASTFERPGCNPDCGPGKWLSYDTQFDRALLRVGNFVVDPPVFNAEYVVVTFANDCLHSAAFGVPQEEASPCSTAEVNAFVDRLVALGDRIVATGMTPVFPRYPAYETLDLATFGPAAGLMWMVNEEQYNELRDTHASRLASEVAGGIVVMNAWKGMGTVDGLHPDPQSAMKAARRVARAILEDYNQ